MCPQLWDLRQPGCKVVEYRGHQQTTACCVFLPALADGTVRVATSSHDSTIRIWDQNSAGGAHTHTSPDPVLQGLDPAGVCDIPGWGTEIPAGMEPLRTGSGHSCMLRPINSLLKATLHLSSLFSHVTSGWGRPTGFSVSHRLQQSAVRQLQLRPPPCSTGPGSKPGSRPWHRWHRWPGY